MAGYSELLKEFQGDPQFLAVSALTDLEECLCVIHAEQKLPFRVALTCIGWFVRKIIYWRS